MNKKAKFENVLNAAGRHLCKRNCSEIDILKRSKLKLKQTTEQYENCYLNAQKKIISVSSCSLTDHEADVQYSRLKSWIESLDQEFRLEMEDLLFPAFISLYQKLKSGGNVCGAHSFYSRHQSNFFKIPEFRNMAERFCSDNNNHFTLELSQESFEVLSNYVASSEHPILQCLLNTTVEINILRIKGGNKADCSSLSPKSNTINSLDLLVNGAEEGQDLMAAIARMNELLPTAPLLKMHTIDTGQRKMCAAASSSCHNYLSAGFLDSTIAIWDLRTRHGSTRSEGTSLDLASAVGFYHPFSSRSDSEYSADASVVICHGHSGPVYSTVFTPSNTHLLTSSDDTTLRLWDLSSMENKVIYRGHTYPVWTADISRTGQYFASASQDRTAKLWIFDRTYPLRILAGHTADVDCVNFHPNGMYVATGSADSSVRMWSVTEGNIVRILVGHRGTVLAVAFSPCGKLLASAGEDHRVKIWDVGSSSILHDFAGHNDVVHGLVWISEQLIGSFSADGSLRVWSLHPPPARATVSSSGTANKELASYFVPSPWKPVHLARGQRGSLICIAASD